jgi:aryl-alcohol dehydrogenase-like predicted oxidoreductase
VPGKVVVFQKVFLASNIYIHLSYAKGCTQSQLAIAWVLAQGKDIIAIPGTKRVKYLEENIAAENVQLTPEDLKTIEAIMPVGIVSGTRYPERFMNALGR